MTTFSNLLLPIEGYSASATGPDLSFSPEFDRIAELRRAEDPTLDQGDWVREIKSADHAGTIALCSELLATRTKDLRLSGWLTEALGRTQGFTGLAEGLSLCAGLLEAYWDDLHPLPDPDVNADALAERFEQRIGNLVWLLNQVDNVAQSSPLLQLSGVQLQGLTLNSQGPGRRVIEGVRTRRNSESKHLSEPTEEQIDQAIQTTPGEQIMGTLAALAAALEALGRLQTVVDAHLGVEGPNFAVARESLQGTQHLLTRIANDRSLMGSDVQGPGPHHAAQADGPSSSGAVGALNYSGLIQSRAQAIAQLRAVADFFRRTEPHSPVAYLAYKAAHWGEVPLHEWLRIVMKDQSALAHIEELLGIEPPVSGASRE